MAIPDLDVTVRMLGLPVPELWFRYASVGGNLPLGALSQRIAGQVDWSREEELCLAVALSEALLDASLASLDPLPALVDELRAAGVWPVADRPDAPVVEAPQGAVDLDQLIVRAQEARAAAQQIRHSAQEARRKIAHSARDLVGTARPTARPGHHGRS